MEEWLTTFGDPYVDALHNHSDVPQEHVIAMLESSSMLIACITPAYFDSPWVRLELEAARQCGIPMVGLRLAQALGRSALARASQEAFPKTVQTR
jgi:hypothetical protein